MAPLFGQLPVEQCGNPFVTREPFGDPLCLDRAEDARNLWPGGHSARDDRAALEREHRRLPAAERGG